ncbi:E3 ubiquitin-protein ligase UBR4-like, partial [Notechis scutatus]|uniref:E3 ubiquitin-protein ligase UBR4-like n=1 Tax=Notechis scutatus TaxID=8663 RepID=A0A6J1W5Z0_9SAUR
VLYFLLQVSFLVDEGVSPVLLQLLSCALCGSKVLSGSASAGSSGTTVPGGSSSGQPSGQSKSSTKKSKKEDKEKEREGDGSSGSQEDQLCTALVNQLNKFADKETLIQFLRCFLLESNSSSVRWQAHCLTLHIYR